MKRRVLARAWLSGLVLMVANAVSNAQQAASQVPVVGNSGAATAASSLPADIPVRRESEDRAASSGQWAFLLWGVIVLAGATWVWARRRQKTSSGETGGRWSWIQGSGKTPGTGPRTMGQTRLTPRHSLHTVQWHGAEYLIGCSDHGMQLLAQRPLNETRPHGDNAP